MLKDSGDNVLLLFFPAPRAWAIPFSAQLSLSEPPAVKKISAGSAPRPATTWAGPFHSDLGLPALGVDAGGLPYPSFK